jgi:hypothetical protein
MTSFTIQRWSDAEESWLTIHACPPDVSLRHAATVATVYSYLYIRVVDGKGVPFWYREEEIHVRHLPHRPFLLGLGDLP